MPKPSPANVSSHNGEPNESELVEAARQILRSEDYPVPHDDDAADIEVLDGEYLDEPDGSEEEVDPMKKGTENG